jgi:hypothetical protein
MIPAGGAPIRPGVVAGLTGARGRHVPARILLYALEELRHAFAGAASPDADPRSDTAPFRAFRGRLLAEAARAAKAEAALSMWWEGTYNGYVLAIAIEPADALDGLDPDAPSPSEGERKGAPRTDRHPLAAVAPGRAELARDADGATWEAPFGAATGHFGAPGLRKVRRVR